NVSPDWTKCEFTVNASKSGNDALNYHEKMVTSDIHNNPNGGVGRYFNQSMRVKFLMIATKT
ncbi:MAG: hypothetical protein WBV71_04300, partial [Roseobacter sp.]